MRRHEEIPFQYPVGNTLVPYGTPLHSAELFLQVLKMTFADFPEGHPFRYVEGNFKKTGVLLDMSLNKESKAYGKKPTIIVSNGPQTTQPTMLGDLGTKHIPTAHTQGSNLVQASLIASILSKSKAECNILTQYVFGLCMICRVHFPRLLHMHMLRNISATEVNRLDDDDAMFQAQVQLQFISQYVWSEVIDAPVLRSIGLKLFDQTTHPEHHKRQSVPQGTESEATGNE